MIKSMTGYGNADYEAKGVCISAEVKSLNAKHAEVSLRLPKELVTQEIAWRNLIIAHLKRGKINVSVTYTHKSATSPQVHIDQVLFKEYYQTLQTLAAEVSASSLAIFQLAIQLPGVVTQVDPSASYSVSHQIFEKVMLIALQQCEQSRQQEGVVLANKLLDYLQILKKGLREIEKLDPIRSQTIRANLRVRVSTWVATQAIDDIRFEQELLYYLERLDITEEQVRLAQHIAYFEEIMKSSQAVGKKLSFIAQEIGREINTIGAKANDATIQREVILMKDALEKIKEQLQNIL